MSREIKYRVWDVDGKEMLSVFRIDFSPETGRPHTVICGVAEDGCAATRSIWNATEEIFKPAFILMQSTGLSDKNGKPGYESDIIQTFYDDGRKGDIGYLECTNLGSLCVIVKGKDVPTPLYFYPSWEILGDLYQHPHLLP